MAGPFGGHPTLASYLHWIRECGGYANSGYASDKNGRVQSMTKITTAEGNSVVVAGIQQHERLEPTMVAYLDRRLLVKSPWRSLP